MFACHVVYLLYSVVEVGTFNLLEIIRNISGATVGGVFSNSLAASVDVVWAEWMRCVAPVLLFFSENWLFLRQI
jgi:hypothetical protein